MIIIMVAIGIIPMIGMLDDLHDLQTRTHWCRFWTEALSAQCLAGNVVAYGAAIGACEKNSQWQWAIYLLSTLQKQIQSNPSLAPAQKPSPVSPFSGFLGGTKHQDLAMGRLNQIGSLQVGSEILGFDGSAQWTQIAHVKIWDVSKTSHDISELFLLREFWSFLW